MRPHKWLLLGVAIVIIALETFFFSLARTDDIGVPSHVAMPSTAPAGGSTDQADTSMSTSGETR